MYDIKRAARNQKQESVPELCGGLIICLFQLAFYLSVPCLIFAACIKVLFF